MTDSGREAALQAFLSREQLPAAYLEAAQRWFDPLAAALAGAHSPREALLVGVNGCQGSGKSTLCEYLKLVLARDHALQAVTLSIDDVYHTRATRQQLARDIHPLLATRGVPGTHDMALLHATLQQLQDPGAGAVVRIPRFDKSRDDRKPEAAWDEVTRPVDLVILEGWCLGVPAQEDAALPAPVNALEEREDPDGRWRHFVNDCIRRDYQPLYDRMHQWVMLQAPSFDCVFEWRLEQERKLGERQGGKQVMDAEGVARFIQFYQRLTEHGLDVLPEQVDHLLVLDTHRQIESSRLAAQG